LVPKEEKADRPSKDYLPISLLNPRVLCQQNSADSGVARLAYTRTLQKDRKELLYQDPLSEASQLLSRIYKCHNVCDGYEHAHGCKRVERRSIVTATNTR